MAYKTQGVIADIRLKKKTDESENTSSYTLSFTLDPTPPYAFETTQDGKNVKAILLENGSTFEKKLPKETEFEADFNGPSMSLAALLLMKQNRTKICVETSSTVSPYHLTKIEII